MLFDASGNVIATLGLACPPPWEVRESGKHPGRCYFFNLYTDVSAWSLPPWPGLSAVVHGNAPTQLSPDPNLHRVDIAASGVASDTSGRDEGTWQRRVVTASPHKTQPRGPLMPAGFTSQHPEHSSTSAAGYLFNSTREVPPLNAVKLATPSDGPAAGLEPPSLSKSARMAAIRQGSSQGGTPPSIIGGWHVTHYSAPTLPSQPPPALLEPTLPAHNSSVHLSSSPSASPSTLTKSERLAALRKGVKAPPSPTFIDRKLGQPSVACGDLPDPPSPSFPVSSPKTVLRVGGTVTKSMDPATADGCFNLGAVPTDEHVRSALRGLTSPSLGDSESTVSLSQRSSSEDTSAPPSSPPSRRRTSPLLAPFRVLGGLGSGGYAVVVAAECTSGNLRGQRFALKCVAKERCFSRFGTHDRDLEQLQVELRLMTEVPPSPFLQRCHRAFESATDCFFVMDLVAGGDLFFHLQRRIQASGGGFSEHEARGLLAGVVLALEHLHLHGFLHRDIKVRTCLCTGGE